MIWNKCGFWNQYIHTRNIGLHIFKYGFRITNRCGQSIFVISLSKKEFVIRINW